MTFSISIDTDRPLPAYNNQVIKFTDDLAGAAVKATITVGSNIFVVFPDSFANFYFNFREVFKVLVQTDYLQDQLDITSGWIHNSQPGYVEQLVNIEIEDDATNTENQDITYKIWRAALQLEEYRAGNYIKSSDFIYILSPSSVVTYFDGLPLDISIYSDGERDVFLRRKDGGFVEDSPILEPLSLVKGINRITISTGSSDLLIAGIAAIYDGENVIEVIENDGEADYVRGEFTVIKKPSKCGPYLKWLNSYGGWSYYQFDGANTNRAGKSSGFINRDFDGLPNTDDQLSELGRDSQEEMNLVAYGISQSELPVIASLIDSPKVYRFIGTEGETVSLDDWISESIGNGKVQIDSSIRDRHIVEMDLEKNPRNTIRI